MDFEKIDTEPPTSEDWRHPFKPCRLRVYRAGRLAGQLKIRPRSAGGLFLPAV
jgi:hypothetical protein